MAEYTYTVVSPTGSKVEGKREAENKDELMKYLVSKNFTVLNIRETLGLDFKRFANANIGGLPLNERVLVMKQLATMISAGIPIIQAVGIIEDQLENQTLKEKFSQIYKKIESGFPLSKAFIEAGGILSEVQVNLLAAGEKSGNLNEMLLKIAEDLENSKKLRGKLIGALIYPAIIMVVLVIVVAVMIIVMVPQVTSLYLSLGASESDIPFVTRLLVNLGSTLGSPLFLILAIISIVTGVLGYRVYASEPSRKLTIDKVKLKIPIFGNLIAKVQLAEFCRITAMLLKSGVPIIDAMETVSRAMGNTVHQVIIEQSMKEVKQGAAVSLAIAKNNINEAFPLILIRIMATGEEAGNFEKVLEDMNLYYAAEVEQITSNLTKLLEPFILVLVGGLVAFLAVAIYLPLYSVGDLVQ